MTVEGPAEYLPRLLDGKLREVLAFSPAVVVEGPRGFGKTTTGGRAASSFLAMDEVDVAGGSPGALGP